MQYMTGEEIHAGDRVQYDGTYATVVFVSDGDVEQAAPGFEDYAGTTRGVVLSDDDGATIEVGMIGAEGMVGLPALLGGKISAQHVVIQIPGSALRMNAALCKTGFDQSATIRATFLRFTEGILNLSAQTAACNRLHAIDQRCARWLLMAFDRTQSDVMPMTQEFLSSMLGVRRAGVTEAAGELQRSGLIRYQHGRITLIDREGLEASACECYRIDHERLLQLLRRVGSSSTESRHLLAVH